MRYCFYRTDLGQNAVFHNFALQIALIHDDRSTRAVARCSYMETKNYFDHYDKGQQIFLKID